MAKKILFLQLSAEFGSTKFGPFQGAEVRLGSDPGRNDISLPENLGVSPEHARLVKQQDDTFIVAPVDRTSQVFVHRKDGRAAKQITAPLALSDGDGFSLVAAEGPKFIIVLEHPKQAGKADDGGPKAGIGKAASRLSAKSLMGEVKRIGFAKAIASSSGNFLMKAWTFIKSGAFLQPRYIILGMFLLSGYLFAGTMSCGAIGLGASLASTQEELTNVKDQCNIDDTGEKQKITIGTEVEKLLGKAGAGKELRSLLEKDDTFSKAFKQHLSAIKAHAADYEWIKDKNNALEKWQKVLAKSSVYDAPLVRVFTYIAAVPGDWSSYDKYRILTSATEDPDLTCYRGPLLISWRQAKRFQFTNTLLDIPVDLEIASQGSRDTLEPLLENYSARIGPENKVDLVDGDVIVADTKTQIEDTKQCMYVQGDDDRDTDISTLPANLKKVLGKSAPGVPASGQGNYTLNRAIRWYAADLERGYTDMDKSLMDSKLTLDSQIKGAASLSGPGKEYLTNKVAELYARAAIMPCLGVMGRDDAPDWMKKDAMAEESKIQCAIFLFLIDEGAGK